jgi:hypothetical protein
VKLASSKPCLVLIALFAVSGISAARGQTAHLTLQSQPGDFIGQGQNWDVTYTPATGAFFANVIQLTNGLPSEIDFVLGTPANNPNNIALLFFGTDQLGIPLQPGFFPNAERAAFASPGHPGLDISFQNRGSNTLTGQFTINNIFVDASNKLMSFSAAFEQHSEGFAPALFGTFTYSAVSVPEPATYLVGTLAGLSVLIFSIRRRRSTLVTP